ncbi:MAG: hypothetical protein Ta2G_00480 [Termitinemataceae bacterium]|nr:MAG: hypothetical protein Ta2G_00480 [Termitinemataceae bacterium]
MKNLNKSKFLYILIGLSAMAWIVLSFIKDKKLSNIVDFFELISDVATIDTIAIFIFTKWLWKCRIFKKWLVPFPNLNGTWTGNIYSDWINPETNQPTPPIPVMLTIKQTFFNISCLMQTTEMKSYSNIEGFSIDEDRQIKQITYSYTSRSRIVLNQRSPPHDGTIVFDILEKPDRKLKGRYWTERKTKGEITLTFHSKELYDDLVPEINSHPITEDTNRR